MPQLRTALEIDRASLNLADPRDGLIADLQNAHAVMTDHGMNVGFLRGVCRDLVESGVWNADELKRVHDAGTVSVYIYHAALRRSLQARF